MRRLAPLLALPLMFAGIVASVGKLPAGAFAAFALALLPLGIACWDAAHQPDGRPGRMLGLIIFCCVGIASSLGELTGWWPNFFGLGGDG